MDEEKYSSEQNYIKTVNKHSKSSAKSTAKEKKSAWKNVLLSIFLVVVFCIGGLVGYLGYTLQNTPSVSDNRIDPSTGDDNPIAIQRQEGVYTFLVCGKDKVALNTDTILVFSLDTKNDAINVMSIPRDTMSDVDRYVKKINAAYATDKNGNIDALKKEITMLLGINIDRFVMVNMSAFEELIDAIGGVKIDVKQDMHYEDPYQNLSIHISKGLQTLDGEDCVGFLRYRSGYANGDLGRIEAQQQFISALMEKLKSPSIISKIPSLAEIVVANMETNLTVQDIIWFAQEALNVDLSTNMQTHTMPGKSMWVYTGKQWLSYYVPDEAGILTMVNAYFNPYDTEVTADMLELIDPNSMKMSEELPRSSSADEKAEGDEKSNDESIEGKNEDSSSGDDEKETSANNDQSLEDKDNESGDSITDDNHGEEQAQTQVVVDSKGNIYEINIQTGEIVQIIHEVQEEVPATTEENLQ